MDNISRHEGSDVGISKANLRKINNVEQSYCFLYIYIYIESSQALQEMSKPAQHLDFFSFCFKYEKADKECFFIYLYFPKR